MACWQSHSAALRPILGVIAKFRCAQSAHLVYWLGPSVSGNEGLSLAFIRSQDQTLVCYSNLCIRCISPFIEGLHGNVLQDESTADHEGGSSQADGTSAAKIEAVGLVTPGAALDEVDHNHRGGCIQGAVHSAHGCSQDTRDDYPSHTCTSPLALQE